MSVSPPPSSSVSLIFRGLFEPRHADSESPVRPRAQGQRAHHGHRVGLPARSQIGRLEFVEIHRGFKPNIGEGAHVIEGPDAACGPEPDPGLFQKKLIELKADAEVQRLTIELRRAMAQSPQEPARIKSLQQLLRGQLRIRLGFELHNQQLYIERIEQQLESLRARTAWEREHFDTVVEQELARLTGSGDPIQAARE